MTCTLLVIALSDESPIASSVFGGNSFRPVDDLLFVLQSQRLGAAVGDIDDQIVVPSHDARKREVLVCPWLRVRGLDLWKQPDPAERIPLQHEKPPTIRVRKDIRSLTQEELNRYRAQLDDVMHVADPSPASPWQKLTYIHTNWCLHYQEAFLFWHRAYLLFFEQMLGMAIPYWNWMANDADVDGSLMPAFLRRSRT